MRYLVTVKLKDGTFTRLISEFSQTICSWWKSEQFYNKYTLSVSLSKSVQFGHLYRKLHNRNWRNLLKEWRIKSPWSVPFEFSFCGGKTRFTHAIAANKRANSHNFKIKNLNLLTITFLAVYLMNRGKSSYTNESGMRVNNTFR